MGRWYQFCGGEIENPVVTANTIVADLGTFNDVTVSGWCHVDDGILVMSKDDKEDALHVGGNGVVRGIFK